MPPRRSCAGCCGWTCATSRRSGPGRTGRPSSALLLLGADHWSVGSSAERPKGPLRLLRLRTVAPEVREALARARRVASPDHVLDVAGVVCVDVTGALGTPQRVHRSELVSAQLPADGAPTFEHRGEVVGVHHVVVPLTDHAVAALPVTGRWDGC